MKWLYRLFRQDPNSREGVISVTSGLGIIVNLLIAAMKVAVGAIAGSLAIISEGINNATDGISSTVALVGAKLAKKHPTEKHPFGYGRIEYLFSLIISALILVSGGELLIEAIKASINREKPGALEWSALILIVITGIIKFLLGTYTIKMGEKSGSASLVCVGKECRSDSLASLITVISTILFLVFDLALDSYAGILISVLIIKAGIDLLIETISDLLGRPGEKELADTLYSEIRSTEGIVNAADMMLHNYGPDAYSGSVNVEMNHNMTIAEAYEILHRLQLRIMHTHKVTMVFGIYAVDNESDGSRALRSSIASFVRNREGVIAYHAVFMVPEEHKIYCDFTVDYSLKDRDSVDRDFKEYMKTLYPDYEIELTIETDFV